MLCWGAGGGPLPGFGASNKNLIPSFTSLSFKPKKVQTVLTPKQLPSIGTLTSNLYCSAVQGAGRSHGTAIVVPKYRHLCGYTECQEMLSMSLNGPSEGSGVLRR